MEEDLISFEAAKLLDEIGGFNIKTLYYYVTKDSGIVSKGSLVLNGNYMDDECTADDITISFIPAPTHSLVRKWLRKKFNIHVMIKECLIGTNTIEYEVSVYDVDNYKIIRHDSISDSRFDSYRKAVGSGIHKALQLIRVKPAEEKN